MYNRTPTSRCGRSTSSSTSSPWRPATPCWTSRAAAADIVSSLRGAAFTSPASISARVHSSLHVQPRGRIRGIWTLVRLDGSRSVREHSLRAYAPAELSTLLSRAGLDVERAWGSFDRTPLGDGTRTILLARKRESGNGT